jgi:hypothetical protein
LGILTPVVIVRPKTRNEDIGRWNGNQSMKNQRLTKLERRTVETINSFIHPRNVW